MNNFPILKRLSRGVLPVGAILLATAAGLCTQSCGLVNEDLEACAPPPRTDIIVDFDYSYNMSYWQTGEEQDWFDTHAGSVYLYIFDENGYFYDKREKHKEFFAPGEDFSFHFDDTELIPGDTYQMVAVAQGNTIGYDDSDEYKWFKVYPPEMDKGKSRIEEYYLQLYRDQNNDGYQEVGVINYKDQYGQTQQMIDTLWTTKPDQVQLVDIPKVDYKPSTVQMPDTTIHVTVPMMRITNVIRVNVLGPAFQPENEPNPNDYHVLIYFPKGNGTVDFCGDISQSPQPLYYQSLVKQIQPYTQKTVRPSRASSGEIADDSNTATEYCLSNLFGVSRLQCDRIENGKIVEGDKASLQIRDATKEGNPILAEIPNFSDELAGLLNEYYKDNQEFLDREYDFQVDIRLGIPGKYEWYEMGLSVMDWVVRYNPIDW